MTQCQGKNQSVIEFTFDFVPPNRMRIVYTAPDTVEGQTMILNADKFYTYIPSLHRSVWQDVKDGSGNQGKEMGFLYDFVTCSAAAALDGGVAQVEEEGQTYVLESTDETVDVSLLTLTTDDERQVILLNTSDDAPVAISIYQDDELTMEIQVLGYQMNGDFDASWFDIPEK
jgi:outer membrane lipoprotein-sorting protein